MSTATIGNLNVRLGMDTAEFQNGAKKAQSTLGALSAGIKGFAAGLVGALSLAGVTSALQTSVNHMDDLGKAAQKIGIPVEELSKLEYAAKLSDVTLDALTTTMARFSKSLGEIAGGGDNSASAALQAISVSATDAQGRLRPTIDIVMAIADQFATIKDGANKSALAIALFGKSGADMIPLLNGGGAAIRAAGDELERFGGVVGPEAARQAEEFNDNMTRLQELGQAATRSLAKELLPALISLTEQFLAFISNGEAIQSFLEGVKSLFSEISATIETTRKEIEMLSAAFDSVAAFFGYTKPMEITIPGGDLQAGTPFGPPKPKRDAPVMPDSGIAKAAASAAKKEADEAARALERLKDAGQRVWEETRTPIENYQLEIRKLNDLLQAGAIDQATYARAVKQLQDEFTGAKTEAEGLNEVTGQLASTFSSWIGDAIDGTFDLKSALADLAKSAGNSLINSGIQGLFGGGGSGGTGGGLFSGLAGLFSGFSGFYADGGSIPSGKWGIAGEAGPEIISGPSTVTPMGGAQQVSIHVSLSEDLKATVDQKVSAGVKQAVQVSVSESSKQSKRQFGSNYSDFQVRKA